MLLSWPETCHVGLFPGQCWSRRGRAADEQSLCLGQSTEPAGLLRALESMLDDSGYPLRKGTRLAVVVSDSVAAITTLPWQEELRAPEELHGYASACFEQQGIVIDDDWVMRTEFRQHRAMGVAYALPRDWLAEMAELIGARGYRLSRVLPVSAGAHCNQRLTPKEGQSIVLLWEARRISALIYDRKGLHAIDVEPIVATSYASGVRLLRRISASYGEIKSVGHWSPALDEHEVSADLISTCLPDAKVLCFPRGAWG